MRYQTRVWIQCGREGRGEWRWFVLETRKVYKESSISLPIDCAIREVETTKQPLSYTPLGLLLNPHNHYFGLLVKATASILEISRKIRKVFWDGCKPFIVIENENDWHLNGIYSALIHFNLAVLSRILEWEMRRSNQWEQSTKGERTVKAVNLFLIVFASILLSIDYLQKNTVCTTSLVWEGIIIGNKRRERGEGRGRWNRSKSELGCQLE